MSFHCDKVDLLLSENKIELCDDSCVNDSGDYDYEKQLEVSHLNNAYLNYRLFLDNKSHIDF